jgi:GST-like protein
MLDPTLDLYTWHAPNGRKPAILLAELEVPYNLRLVDIVRGEEKLVPFLDLNPNGKIPVLVDRDPLLGRVVVFESGAILQYLCEKHGRFLPRQLGGKRAEVLSWLYWQAAGPSPMFGELEHFTRYKPIDELAHGHFFDEARRLVLVLEQQLVDRDYIAGEYSVADMAAYPWFEAITKALPRLLDDTKEVHHWLRRVGSRPAVKHGMHLEQLSRAA